MRWSRSVRSGGLPTGGFLRSGSDGGYLCAVERRVGTLSQGFSVFVSIGRAAHRWRWVVIAAWFAVFAVSLPFLLRVEKPLKVGGFSSDNTDAARAASVLQ